MIRGPHGDARMMGRKIIIDTYGGWGSHGGATFFGKDPTKVHHSGEYIVIQVGKSIVEVGLARRCLVHVSYSIGVLKTLYVLVDSYGTGTFPDKEILELIKKKFDFILGMMTINIDLNKGGNGRFQKE